VVVGCIKKKIFFHNTCRNKYYMADLDSRLAYLRPRARLRFKTKTLISKTKTEIQDLQEQYWITGSP